MLYTYLIGVLGLVLAEADQTFEATTATTEEAELVNVTPGSPSLLMERIAASQARQPIEYTKMLRRADRYRYVMRLTR